MKITPIKKKNLPKYAAALAAVASATLLTGCHTAGEVATENNVSNPDIEEQPLPADSGDENDEGELVLDGEVGYEGSEDEIELAGDVEVEPEPENSCPPDTPGLVAVPNYEPLTLEGDVAWVPDYQEQTDSAAEALTDEQITAYVDAFSAAGMPLTRTNHPFSHYGTHFTALLANNENGILIAFFDGTAEDQGFVMAEWLASVCTEEAEWGCVLDTDGRVIFIDISKDADPERVAKDVIG